MSLLSLAADAWQGAAFAEQAQSATLKLSSIGVPADPIDIPGFSPKLSNSSKDLETISAAIGSSDYLIFDYLSPNLSAEAREVIPIALSNRSGFWYVSGVDKGVEEFRTFRLDRVQGAITVRKNKEHFEFPSEIELDQIHAAAAVRFAKIDVRKGKGHALRALATSVTDLGEWDQIKVPIYTVEYLTAQILWHGDDVFVHEPADLRENVVKQLQALVVNHE